jgi:hypothetical protein
MLDFISPLCEDIYSSCGIINLLTWLKSFLGSIFCSCQSLKKSTREDRKVGEVLTLEAGDVKDLN